MQALVFNVEVMAILADPSSKEGDQPDEEKVNLENGFYDSSGVFIKLPAIPLPTRGWSYGPADFDDLDGFGYLHSGYEPEAQDTDKLKDADKPKDADKAKES